MSERVKRIISRTRRELSINKPREILRINIKTLNMWKDKKINLSLSHYLFYYLREHASFYFVILLRFI